MGSLRRCRSFRSGLLGFSPRNLKSSTISTSTRRRISSSGFQALKEIIERVKEKGYGVFPLETEFSEEMMEIRRGFVAIHGEMVLLKNYRLQVREPILVLVFSYYWVSSPFVPSIRGIATSMEMSCTSGLIKILKKYDKRTRELLSLPFTQPAVHQPFFTTDPLTRLEHECEENLEVLVPLEAEVVEYTAIAQEQLPGDISKPHLETTIPLGEELVDISRSISAARRALQGLKKESSTYNPLSLSYLFGNQDLDSMGAVTAENSPCESLVTLHDGEDKNKDVGSPK